MKKFYITTPIYYINAKPHIGHAYTTISADMLARYWRTRLGGENVHFLTGTDEHGAKIAQQAEKEGKETAIFADEVSAQFQFAWDRLNISNNDFIRTTEKRHEDVVTDFLLKLKEAKTPLGNDAIYEGMYEGMYCVACEAFKTDDDLTPEGLCADHKIAPQHLKEKNWFFRLSDYAPAVRSLLESGELKVIPNARQNEVLGLIDQGLRDLAISRQSITWGIPVPWDTKQTIYVWVDALLNYFSAVGGFDGELTKKFWPPDCQLMSKDILKFHAVIWTSMLLALKLPVPKTIAILGYFTVNGEKMSKTIGNVIDPNELVEKYGTDSTRYLLVSQFGFGTDGDISLERLQELYNAHLAGGLGNLVSRVTAMAEKYFEGKVPEQGAAADPFEVKNIWKTYDESFEHYLIDQAVHEIWKLITLANQYIDDNKPWELAKNNPEKLSEVIYNLLEVIRQITVMIIPFMPETADKILANLGYDAAVEKANDLKDLRSWAVLPVGAIIKKGEGLFPRI